MALGNGQLAQLAGYAGAVVALAGAAEVARRGVWAVVRLWRQISRFLEDWNGEPDRPGVPGRPGVMERLSRIEQRLDRLPPEPAAPRLEVVGR